MPTKPNELLLDRDLSKFKPMIDVNSPFLQEVINYATQFYQRCHNSETGETDETFPAFALYLHLIQITDGIEILISNGSVETANILLRSSFEARLALGYLLEKDSKRRAYSWLVNNIINSVQELERMSPKTHRGREFKNSIEKGGLDKPIPGFPASPATPEDMQIKIAESLLKYREALKEPGYAEAYTEYLALVKQKVNYPKWYSYYGGPRSLKQLANLLNKGALYETLYVNLSEISHASDVDHLTIRFEDGKGALGPIRSIKNFPHITTTAITLLLESTNLMLIKFRSFESTKFQDWLTKDVLQRFLFLQQLIFVQRKELKK